MSLMFPCRHRMPVTASLFALAIALAGALPAHAKPNDTSKPTAKAERPPAKSVGQRAASKPAITSHAAARKVAAKPAAEISAKKTVESAPKKKGPSKAAPPARWKVETIMGRGDTLAQVLRRQGIDGKQASNAVRAVGDIYDPRLVAGDKLTLMLERRPEGPWLRALNLDPRSGQELTIQVEKDGAPSKPVRAEPASLVVRRAEGTIANAGFRDAMRAAHVPETVAADVITAFRADPDVPRKLPKRTRFAIVYEAEARKRGGVSNPALRFAAVNVNGKVHPVYRYQMDDGDVVFVDKDGRGVTHVDLGAPIRNAKITSGFGWRVHPVHGDSRFHKGVDFAAPEGTPVYAAEDGIIDEIGWRGGYGEYIRIKHKGQIATHYAHLSDFAPGLREGSRVRKGQLIGRVGETGIATGPHLDYGVIVGDEHVDPLAAHPVIPIRLAGSDLKGFRSFVKRAGSI